MFSFDAFLDLLPRDGECIGEPCLLLTGGVGGTSPVSLTRESMLLHSIFRAATGERTKMSRSSGTIPSSGGSDAIGGTTPGSVEGSGAEGRVGGGEVASFDGFSGDVASLFTSCGSGLPIVATDRLEDYGWFDRISADLGAEFGRGPRSRDSSWSAAVLLCLFVPHKLRSARMGHRDWGRRSGLMNQCMIVDDERRSTSAAI